ncbi:hypothetical protein ABZY57_28295 [Streptomyces sp. NPDC006450]|uniref:D-alanyl-D-alanine carboxypeptidase family protein n=1 Tax=Streptomyces sp. NPDC006450 TaxID=3155458 RepID=UPI0033B38DFA
MTPRADADRSTGSASDTDCDAAPGEPAAAAGSAGSDRTASFRTVTPPAGTGQPEDSASGADRARGASGEPAADAGPVDSERTAVFRTVTPPPSAALGRPAGSASAPAGEPTTKPAESADSERTSVFRTTGTPASGAPASGASAPGTPASGTRTPSDAPATPGTPAPRDSGSTPASPGTPASPAPRDSASAPATPGTSGTPAPRDSAATPASPGTPGAPATQRPPAIPGTPGASGTPEAPAPRASASAPGKQAPSGGQAPPRTPGAPAAAGDPRSPGGSGSGSGSGEPVDSERTAVFRAVKPGSGDGSAPVGRAEDSERTAAFRAVKPPAPAAPADDAPADSERTAVFRAFNPGTANPGAAQPGTANPTPRQGNGAAQPVPPRAVGGERASTFVPLRSDDVPPRPTPGTPPAPGAPRAASTPAPASASASAPASAPGQAPGRTPVPAGVRTPVTHESAERTTQQPLPPKPPLDMLADLTNNPPPPPSAARTAVRRFKIYAPILVLLALVVAVIQLVRPLPTPTLKVTANTSYTFEGGAPNLPWPKEGQAYMAAAGLGPVGSFGEQKPVAIGSVAKAMTAYVILKDFPMKKGEEGAMIPVDKTAVDDGKKETEGESTVNNLKEGGKISQKDALSAIMIPSANNVARLLARWDGGQEAFVKKMNDTARELGMTNTTYTDPSGLDATTVSTAEDQVKLGLKIVEMPELIAITMKPSWTDSTGKKWRNYNDLVPFNGSLGIKTGSTTKAGGNLLFAAEKKVGKTNQLIVGAVLGQHGVPILGTAIAASKDVMLATQKMLTAETVVKKGTVVGYVDDGLGTRVPVVATADVEAVGWPTLTISTKLADNAGKLPQTAKAGSEIGVLTVGEGASQVKVPVALQSDLVAPGIGKKLTRLG